MFIIIIRLYYLIFRNNSINTRHISKNTIMRKWLIVILDKREKALLKANKL